MLTFRSGRDSERERDKLFPSFSHEVAWVKARMNLFKVPLGNNDDVVFISGDFETSRPESTDSEWVTHLHITFYSDNSWKALRAFTS